MSPILAGWQGVAAICNKVSLALVIVFLNWDASGRPKKHDPAAVVKWANLASQQRLGVLTSPDKQLEAIVQMQKSLSQKDMAANAAKLSGVFDDVLVQSTPIHRHSTEPAQRVAFETAAKQLHLKAAC